MNWRSIAFSIGVAAFFAAGFVRAGETDDLAWAAQRGADLFDFDRAAWVASDALMADLTEMPDGKPGGWVVVPLPDGALEVSFIVEELGAYQRFYVAKVAKHQVIETRFAQGEDRRLTDLQQKMLAARDAAVRKVEPVCQAQPYNTVVLPGRAASTTDVYLLTPQIVDRVYPIGGHTRVTVGYDGAILSEHAFLRSCLTADTRALGEPVAFNVSHLNDPLPTEIHVFLSIWMQIPIAVLISETKEIWIVAGSRISRYEQK